MANTDTQTHSNSTMTTLRGTHVPTYARKTSSCFDRRENTHTRKHSREIFDNTTMYVGTPIALPRAPFLWHAVTFHDEIHRSVFFFFFLFLKNTHTHRCLAPCLRVRLIIVDSLFGSRTSRAHKNNELHIHKEHT